MNNEQFNFRKDDNKQLKKLIFIGIITILISIIVSNFLFNLDYSSKENFVKSIRHLLFKISPFTPSFLFIIFVIPFEFFYKKSKTTFYEIKNNYDNEDEYAIKSSKIDIILNYLLFFSNLNFILNFLFFSIWSIVGTMVNPNYIVKVDGVRITLFKSIFSVLSVILTTFYLANLQKRVFNLKKEMNPLLKGSVYDFNFNKKFIESSDEALKLVVYKSTYKSHNLINVTCFILLCLFSTLNNHFNIGIIPPLTVAIILLVQNITYYVNYIKLSKH